MFNAAFCRHRAWGHNLIFNGYVKLPPAQGEEPSSGVDEFEDVESQESAGDVSRQELVYLEVLFHLVRDQKVCMQREYLCIKKCFETWGSFIGASVHDFKRVRQVTLLEVDVRRGTLLMSHIWRERNIWCARQEYG